MKNTIIWFLVAVFLVGAIVIVYRGRPVQKLSHEQNALASLRTENDEVEKSALELNDGEKSEQLMEFSVENPTSEQTSVVPVDTKTAVTSPSVRANIFTVADIAKHNIRTDCWSTINGSVYDLTSFVDRHPGGAKKIMMICGVDGSGLFDTQHNGSSVAQASLGLLKIGVLK